MDATRLATLIGILFAAVALYWLLPRRVRPAMLSAVSISFVFAFGWLNALYILLNVFLGYAAARAIHGSVVPRRSRLLRVAMVWIIGTFVFFKVGPVLPSFLADRVPFDIKTILIPLGLSYVLFRILHFVMEVYRKKIVPDSLATYVAYVLFFPTFLAGPVERYPAFRKQTEEISRFEWGYLAGGVGRILLGAFKKVVLANQLAAHVLPRLAEPGALSSGETLLSMYGLAFYLYMDFSGYTDMALGVSRLFGYRVIENFNHPFFRASIAEFWRNWHISLYSFIRDYFFYPIFARSVTTAKISVGLLCTMILFMLWHEVTWSWLLLGVYHGLALVVWNHFQDYKRSRPKLRKGLATPIGKLATGLLTFHFLCFGFVLFFFDLGHALAVMRSAVALS